MNTQSTYQYGTSMLPVLLNSVMKRETGAGTLRQFLPHAWEELENQSESSRLSRTSVTRQTTTRTERLMVSRYFDLDQRKQKALRKALESVENYLQDERKEWLEKALRQYETGERFLTARLRMRMELEPMVCERISRAS